MKKCQAYSDIMCARWTIQAKAYVEKVFNVELSVLFSLMLNVNK